MIDGLNKYNGLRIAFIGNSFVYFGGLVESGTPCGPDHGAFYRLCRSAGIELTVYNCTYGGHHLRDFTARGCLREDTHGGADLLAELDFSGVDCVFFSESGDNNPDFLSDSDNLMARFPAGTKFFYLCHSYTYFRDHEQIKNALPELENRGVKIVDWGKLVYDISMDNVQVPGARLAYGKTSFVNSVERDYHHPNPLAGYLAALMSYRALTGDTAVGKESSFLGEVEFGGKIHGFDAYAEKYYSPVNCTNFREILASPEDMRGLQLLVDRYV